MYKNLMRGQERTKDEQDEDSSLVRNNERMGYFLTMRYSALNLLASGDSRSVTVIEVVIIYAQNVGEISEFICFE